ncbi:MAG: NUDIX hydrolase [bacterium]|nr:NUDIX hydrolase [bacterium]
MEQARPGVGIGVCVRKDGKVLMGKRRGGLMSGTWAIPGGKLDMYEELEVCAIREILEETGIEIKNVRFITFTNDIAKDSGMHYLTLFYEADWKAGEPQVLEPDKCEEWRWSRWDSLPQPLFISTRNLVDSGYNPFNV